VPRLRTSAMQAHASFRKPLHGTHKRKERQDGHP